MSDQQRTHRGPSSEREDLADAVLAADDTGMVRNEADIASAELLEETELLEDDRGASGGPQP
jgi:hypothetical protein